MLSASDVSKIKIVVVIVPTVLMLLAATAFWTDALHAHAPINWIDFRILALHSQYYQATIMVIVGIAGLLLWRWGKR